MRSDASLILRAAIAYLLCAGGLMAQATPQLQEQLVKVPAGLRQKDRESGGPGVPIAQVRQNLTWVLAQREFERAQKEPDQLQRAERAAMEWIIERLESVAGYGGRNPWITRVLEWGGILVPAVLLVWWTTRRLGRERAPHAPRSEPSPWAPSAREWQLWLQEADTLAQQRRWREAVHHAYWAAISRLEANGLWAADRARTPREYLALIRRENLLRPDLVRLTRLFEGVWYGTAPAGEEQYIEARSWTDKLASR